MAQIYDSMDSAKQQVDPKAALDAAVKISLGQIKHKLIVMSGKGGVGKSSTAVNLSMALARLGAKVGLVDVDLHGPDVPRMLGLTGMPGMNAENKLIPLAYNENLSAVSVESLTEGKDDAIIWRGPVKYSVIQQFIGQVAWGPLDFLIIDAPPGTGDEPLTVAQTIQEAQAVIVTTPQKVSLADVRKSINFCKTVKMEIFGLIENMSGLVCPHCNCDVDLFGTGGGEETATRMGVSFLGRIPFDPEMVSCTDAGAAYLEKHPDSPVSNAYREIAEKLKALIPA
ncbi:MAG: Mrp/NBP35 family ATP-binding protein [Desulfobacteraceae bacterium]|jgi:Mrp family chromosome partitioning ATPase